MDFHRTRQNLPDALEAERRVIEGHARAAGLDFHEVIFELCAYDEIDMIAALGGFPTRYPHWRWGMEYLRLQKGQEYGLQKIYELVINNDPTWAYLHEGNSRVDQQLVMAHVYAHADFFRNNAWFAGTHKKMVDRMANHAARVRRHIDREGALAVERLIDACLSLDNLVDPYLRGGEARVGPPGRAGQPDRDVMGFVLAHGTMAPWQADILGIVRDEAYYFLPQAQTKILNEGWASFWHTRLMTGTLVTTADVVDYADRHAGTVAAHADQMNPYRLGLTLFRDIERREGLARAFEVRQSHNDVTFLDRYLTEESCLQAGLYTWTIDRKSGASVIDSRGFTEIRARLLAALENRGEPEIAVTDPDHAGRGELELTHVHVGADLHAEWAGQVLGNLARAWGRPVHLRTRLDGRDVVVHHDGNHAATEGARTRVTG